MVSSRFDTFPALTRPARALATRGEAAIPVFPFPESLPKGGPAPLDRPAPGRHYFFEV